MGVTEADRVPLKARIRTTGESPAAAGLATEEGEALPFQSARNDRIRFRSAEAREPWPHIHGIVRDRPGTAPPPAAPSPGHTAGPVLQHRPSEESPLLWTELEGQPT